MADPLKSPNTLLYLYGVTQTPERLPATTRGVDGVSPVEALDTSGFVCWISRVDAVEYGDELSRNMENLEWLADASVRHQRVVGAIHERQSILPARFGTIFLNSSTLSADIEARKKALDAGFRRIADSDEWGIRVFAQPRAVPISSGAKSGKEYLQRKAKLLQAKPSRTLEPEIQQLASDVSKLASDSAEGGKVGAGQPNLRWQTSILLRRAQRATLEKLLAQFSRRNGDRFRVECTGPWPPYSFVAEKSELQPTTAKRTTARKAAR
jgi:hypothetical protein